MSGSLKIEMTRVYKTEPSKVFEAWTKPDVLKKWLAPHETVMTDAVVDLKTGGTFRINMTGQVEGRDINGYASGVYREIVKNERISFTWTWHNVINGDVSGESLVTVTFRPAAGGTEMTLVHDKFDSPEMRQDYEFGWINCFGKLEKLFGA